MKSLIIAALLAVPQLVMAGSVTPHVDSLRLRDGHSIENKVIGEVEKGTELEVLQQTDEGTWTKVRTRDGKVGWVASGYVRPTKN